MQSTTVAHPPIVSRDAWLQERKALLLEEKELTRQRDRINAQRRRLPMVKLEKPYSFEPPCLTYSKDAASSSFTISCLTRTGKKAAWVVPDSSTLWVI